MALFNKEPDRNVKADQSPKAQPQPQPQIQPATPTVVTTGQGPHERMATPIRPNTAPAGESRAYLDAGSKISGKLSFEGPTRIDGQVEGEINAKDSFTIGETAVVTAQIRAVSIIVAGKVSGDIVAAQRIEVRPSARVIGNLTAPVLVVHEGALFEGHCSMQPEAAREDRKITVLPKEDRVAQAAAPAAPVLKQA
jgi:cytoskeletal protein CcmA (bactofilin family)